MNKKKQESAEEKSIIQAIIDFLKELFGLKAGGKGIDPNSPRDMQQLQGSMISALNNDKMMQSANSMLDNPIIRKGAEMYCRQLLKDPMVAGAINKAMEDPAFRGQVQQAMQKYPNVGRFINDVAKSSACENAAKQATTPPVAMHPPQSTPSVTMSAAPNTDSQQKIVSESVKKSGMNP